MRRHAQWLLERFRYPTPRVSLGLALRGLASACIDVSDGLLGDCARLAEASGCGVSLDYAALPVSAALRAAVGEERARRARADRRRGLRAVLHRAGGEDSRNSPRAARPREFGWSRIGALRPRSAARVVQRGASVMQVSHRGFDHFG